MAQVQEATQGATSRGPYRALLDGIIRWRCAASRVTCDVLGEGYRPPRRPCRMVTRGLSFDFTSFCVTRRTLQFCSIAR